MQDLGSKVARQWPSSLFGSWRRTVGESGSMKKVDSEEERNERGKKERERERERVL